MYHAGVQLGAFPAAAKLSSLAKLSEADKNTSTGTEAEAGDGDKLAKAGTAVSSTPTIVVAPGIPALPKKLAQKILNGEYVDFAELPPAKGRAKPSSLDWEGQVLLVQPTDLYATKKLIPDLATWVQCFSIYAAVLCSQSPERLPDLLGYAAFIAKCSQKFKWPSWVVYDQNFRQLAAEETLTTWARPDPGVYAQSFTNYALSAEGWCKYCHSVDHISDTCPARPKSMYPRKRVAGSTYPLTSKRPAIPAADDAICKKYNRYDGDCHFGKNCRFRHVCSSCKKEHPVSQCKEPPLEE